MIPTRNRSHLLASAIRSALAQTHNNFEVLVSDNASDGGTREVLESFGDGRLRSIRTDRALLMHDSWRFAVDAARGEYVTILGDDDALHPRLLEIVDDVTGYRKEEVISWRSCSYCTDQWPNSAERGRLRFGPPFSDGVFKVDAKRLIELVYDMRITFSELPPKFINAFVLRATIERVRDAGAEFFHPSCPDYSAMLVLAAYARGLLLLDVPLVVVGAAPESIGASSEVRGGAARRFVAELRESAPQVEFPAMIEPRIAWLAQTVEYCASMTPALANRRVNESNLCSLAVLELERWRRAGVDVDDIMKVYVDAIAGMPVRDAERVRTRIAEKRIVESEAYLAPITSQRRLLGLGPFQCEDMTASDAGWCSIDEVAAGLDDWLAENTVRLDGFWDRLLSVAGDHTIVIYGLGLNGRGLLRSAPNPPHVVRDRVVLCDDSAQCSVPGFGGAIPSQRLDPKEHFVVITPSDPKEMISKLTAKGFVDGESMLTLGVISSLDYRRSSRMSFNAMQT